MGINGGGASIIRLSVFLNITLGLLFSLEAKEDTNYGQLNQCSGALKQIWFDGETDSNGLCGPTCVVNTVMKFERHFGLHRVRSLSDDVIYLIKTSLKDRDFAVEGVSDQEMIRMLNYALKERGLSSEVKFTDDLDTIDFNSSAQPDKAVLLSLDFLDAENFDEQNPEASEILKSHYVIVTGTLDESKDTLVLNDPLKQGSRVLTKLKKVFSEIHGRHFYYPIWEEEGSPAQPENSVAIVRTAIEVEIY